MTKEEKERDIREHPELHMHDFSGLIVCCMVGTVLDTQLMQLHEETVNIGINGGRRCDVYRGPCSCGAWH